jgi:hypothetical protein
MERILTQVSQEKISSAPYEDPDNSRSVGDYDAIENAQPPPAELFGKNEGSEDQKDPSTIYHQADDQFGKNGGDAERLESFGPVGDEQPTSFPMSQSTFLELHGDVLLPQELEELSREKASFETIYFAGSIPSRQGDDLEILKSLNEERAASFKEKRDNPDSSNNNGEYQGNPVFDNYEGYYRVQIGEHIAYRYEIMKVLGKGSFAQVVQCRDHKQPGSPLFAVKITRNTEMDHKFAHKEAQYLKYIMQEDPHDKHNIVRMVDTSYFREHHCFVFELLHTDLFEHLKATGFVGFSTDKIKDYAV